MTVASTTNRVSYTGNGSASTFDYTFRIFDEADLLVTVRDSDGAETTLSLTTDYTVTGVGSSSGTIVLVSSGQAWLTTGKLSSGYTLIIRRVLSLVQETDIRNQGPFFPEIHEDAFDRLTMIDQQQQDEIDRSIKLPESISASSFDASLPADISDSDNAGKAIVVNADANGFELSEVSYAGTDALAFNDVVYVTFSDSPLTLSSSHRGKVLSVNTSGGAVTVNLPAISGLDLTEAFSVVIKKSTSDANAVTIAPNGSETIDEVASSISIAAKDQGYILVPDKEKTPDDWQSLGFRKNGVTGSPVGTSDTQTLTNKSLVDASTYIVDDSDATKIAKFECSGITTGTTRTITIPDANITLVGTAATQTLTNKTLTSPTLTTPVIDVASLTEQGSTPATPSAGTRKFYATSTGLYQLDSNGNASQVGAGTGGSKNYLTTYKGNTGNGDFELNATTGWSKFNTTLTSQIPTGSITLTASTLDTFSIVSSSQLGGNYSLSVGNTAGQITIGQGFISSAFTIDNEDMAKVMQFSFYYKAVTGASLMNFSGTSSNTWAVYIYDVTNSTWIQPAGVYSMNQSSGIGKASGTFQTSATGTSYRIAVVCVTTNSSGATATYFDDFFVGPQVQLYGSPVTDWTAYTPTGSWSSNTTYTGFYRRIGDSVQVNVKVALSGAPTATNLTVNLPSGIVIDTAKLASSTASAGVLGYANVKSAGASYTGVVLYNNTTSVALLAIRDNAVNTSNKNANVDNTDPNTFANGDEVDFIFIAPVSGWSSSVQMSNDSNTRVLACRTNRSGSQSLSNTTYTKIQLNNVGFDTHGAFDSSTNYRFVAPISGYYLASGSIRFAANATGSRYTNIYKNGSVFAYSQSGGYSADETVLQCSDRIFLNAGDYLELYGYQSSGGSLNVAGDVSGTYLSVNLISGPSAIAATETVFARCYQSSGQSITHNSSPAILNFDTKETDTHGAVTTGASWKFTAPVSGTYRIETSNALTSSTANQISQYVYKNGSQYAQIGELSATGGGISSGQVSGSTSMKLVAGDYIDIRFYQYDNGAVNKNTTGSQAYNHISVARIGN